MCLGSGCDAEEHDRRMFLSGGAAAFAGLAFGSESGQVQAAPPTRVLDDASITHGLVKFQSGAKQIGGYLARPKAAGRYPGVLVVAGNRISEEYIPNTCAA